MKRIIFLSIFLIGSLALAHARLKASDMIKIRSTDPGVKTGPCGTYARGTQPAVLTSGQTINVTWEETIYHPGRFEFYFSSANDANFTFLKSVENNQVNNALPHQFSTTLTLPNVTCTNCTFQMIQVMAENPAAPTYYYSCADMQVKAAGTTTPPAATPTPTPVICAP
jgi:hypothetical protein